MNSGLSLRRILIGLDASPHSMAALAAAAELAAALNAELAGVFVEDSDLLNCFRLPFIRARAQYASRQITFGLEELTHEMQARAAAAAAELAKVATRREVRWTFRTVRGAVSQALLVAAEDVDLVILGRASRTSGLGQQAIGTTVRVVIQQAQVSTLVVAGGQRLRPPVTLLHDGSAAAVSATRMAAYLARQLGGPLHVLVVDGGRDGAGAATPGAQLDAEGVTYRLVRLADSGHHEVLGALAQMRPGLVVAPRDLQWADRDNLSAALDRCHCPILLVR